MTLKFGPQVYLDPENEGAGPAGVTATVATDNESDSGPTLAQALAADRGIVTTSVTSPPAAISTDPVPQPISEPASPPAPVGTSDANEPPLPPGVSPTGVTPNSAALEAQARQQAQQAQQYVQNMQMQQMYNEAIRLGATPDQAKAAIQLLSTQQTIRQQQEALENHPVTREIAAKQIAATYAKWGVKSEDIISAPNPQAMQYAAYTLAQANKNNGNQAKSTALAARTANGNDNFESGTTSSAGSVIDYKKSSGLSLMKRALAMSK